MFPNLIDIGFLHLRTYGAMMAIGFLLCSWLVERLSGRKDVFNLLLALIISGIAGSRIAYVIEHWEAEFANHLERIIRVDQGGLMFYGGFILSVLVFFIWCWRKHEKPLKLADLLAVVIPLGHAFGRIGCFCFGCCYGRDSECWCAVTFPARSPSWFEHGGRMVKVLPTQLFEAGALFLLFALLLSIWHKRKYLHEGLITGTYLIGYAVIRFGIEFLRGDPRAAIGPFSISQTISMAMIILGIGFIGISRRREKAS